MHRPIAFCAATLLAIMSARAPAQTFPSSAGPLAVTTVARGLVEPWSLAFLPDGRMLVTEKPGRMRIVDARRRAVAAARRPAGRACGRTERPARRAARQ